MQYQSATRLASLVGRGVTVPGFFHASSVLALTTVFLSVFSCLPHVGKDTIPASFLRPFSLLGSGDANAFELPQEPKVSAEKPQLAVDAVAGSEKPSQDPLAAEREERNRVDTLKGVIKKNLDDIRNTSGFTVVCKALLDKLNASKRDLIASESIEYSFQKLLAGVFLDLTGPAEVTDAWAAWTKRVSAAIQDCVGTAMGVDKEKRSSMAVDVVLRLLEDEAKRPAFSGGPASTTTASKAPASPAEEAGGAGLLDTTANDRASDILSRFRKTREKYRCPRLDQDPITTVTEFKRMYVDLKSEFVKYSRDEANFPANLKAAHAKRIKVILDDMPGRREDWHSVFKDLDSQLGTEIRAGRFRDKEPEQWAGLLHEMELAMDATIKELEAADKASIGGQSKSSRNSTSTGISGGGGTSSSSAWHERHMNHIYRANERRSSRIQRITQRR